MLERITTLPISELIVFSLLLNLFLYGLSIGLYLLLQKYTCSTYIQEEQQAITGRDIRLSLFTIVCNAIVFLLGVWLYKHGIINVSEQSTVWIIILQTIGLIVGMDFLMYVFHRLAHIPIFYSLAHVRHHEHSSVNAISLFVLHPIEAIGFGLLIVVLLYLFTFDVIAVVLYLTINLLWGTIGHIDKDIFKGTLIERISRDVLCLTVFHNIHHQDPDSNYGFYTLFWDKCFKTYRKV
ncbi:MAG: sterol desaturase family protein [Flavobacterium sp.]